MNRSDALKQLRQSRADWDALVAAVPGDHMEAVLWENGWTAKALIAHVDFYEWWAGELLSTRTMPIVDSSLNVPDQDDRNEALNRINQARDTEKVLADSKRCHEHLVATLESMTDEDFADPSFVDFGFAGDWSPLHLTSSSTWDHYLAHVDDMKRAASG